MRVGRSVEIATPPEKIWPFLVEPEKILKWCITLDKFEYKGEQRSGAGANFYFEEKAAGKIMKLNFKVTEWVDNRIIAFKMTSGNMVKDYEQKWAVEPGPSGSTFTFMENVELPYGVIGKIMGLFTKSSSEAHVKEMLVKLKDLAEA